MRGLILLLAVPAVLACEGATDTGVYTGTAPVRIAGNWTYEFNVYDADSMAHCTTHGTLTINQTVAGDQFGGGVHGEYACIYGGEVPEPTTALVPLSSGELAGLGVRFIAFGCTHLGALNNASTRDRFSGTLNCTFPVVDFGPTRPMSGTWEATR